MRKISIILIVFFVSVGTIGGEELSLEKLYPDVPLIGIPPSNVMWSPDESRCAFCGFCELGEKNAEGRKRSRFCCSASIKTWMGPGPLLPNLFCIQKDDRLFRQTSEKVIFIAAYPIVSAGEFHHALRFFPLTKANNCKRPPMKNAMVAINLKVVDPSVTIIKTFIAATTRKMTAVIPYTQIEAYFIDRYTKGCWKSSTRRSKQGQPFGWSLRLYF